MNKRQWKKQGTKLRHNGHYASYVALFLGVEIKGKPHIDKKWSKRIIVPVGFTSALHSRR